MPKEWMSTEYPKTLLQMKITEKTPRGRPQTQWLDQDNRNIGRKEQSWEKVEEMQE
jgi:hypothetical protein